MALTEEQILQQINVLTQKTSDNPEMVYKTSGTLNKGLNPNYFSGTNTKIVNAINKLAADFATLEGYVTNKASKADEVLLDVHTDLNKPIWEETKGLMEADTIIEGINLILKGHHSHKILNITVDDIDKVLTVGTDENGKLITKAVSLGDLGNTASAVKYENEKLPEVHTVEDAINHLLSGANITPIDINWDMIQNKPEIVDSMELSEGALQIKADDNVIYSINVTVDSDIDEIINELN